MRAALDAVLGRVGFEQPRVVERLLVRGTLVGAVGGGIAWFAFGAARVAEPAALAVACAAALLLLVLPRQNFGLLLTVAASAGVVCPLFSWSDTSLPFFFTVPLGLALAFEPLSAPRRLVAVVGPSLGGAWCMGVAHLLGARYLGGAGWLSVVAMVAAGLFVSTGAALAWVYVARDDIEPRLVATPRVQLTWRRLRSGLGRLPAGRSRDALCALARAGAERYLCARAAADVAGRSLDLIVEDETEDAVAALKERLALDGDAELRAHLTQLLRVHQDTLEQLTGLRRRVERLDAHAVAEAAWLDTAAFSLEVAPTAEPLLADVVARLATLSSARPRAPA